MSGHCFAVLRPVLLVSVLTRLMLLGNSRIRSHLASAVTGPRCMGDPPCGPYILPGLVHTICMVSASCC